MYQRIKLYEEKLNFINQIYFTEREIDVIACLAHLKSDKQIGGLLRIATKTVNSHLSNLINKVKGGSREQVIDFVRTQNLLPLLREYYGYLLEEDALFKALEEKNKHEDLSIKLNLKSLNADAQAFFKMTQKLLSQTTIKISIQKTKYKEVKLNKLADKKDFYGFLFSFLNNNAQKVKFTSMSVNFKEKRRQITLDYGTAREKNTDRKKNKIKTTRKAFALMLFFLVSFFVILGLGVYFLKYNLFQKEKETWNLPTLLKHFTERKEVSRAIWDKFGQSKNERETVVLVGLHGLGGVGKTTLATRAVHYPMINYAFKGWFSAENENLLRSDYLELGEYYHLFAKGMSDRLKIIKVKEWLESRKSAFIIYDNVSDSNMLKDYIPNKGHILITSRNYKLPGAIEIDVMTKEESLQLLENLIPAELRREKLEVEKLATKLGYLPLAMSQAGAYISQNSIPISEYLEIYTKEKHKLLANSAMPPMDIHEPVYITWNVSLKKLKKELLGKKAVKLLEFLSFCHSEKIPKILITNFLFNNMDSGSVIETNKCFDLLREYSFIKADRTSISIHRLVHTWLQESIHIKDREQVLKKGINALHKTHLIGNKKEVDVIFSLLPHIKSFFKKSKFLKKNREYYFLSKLLGDCYYRLGFYKESIAPYLEALRFFKPNCNPRCLYEDEVYFQLSKSYIEVGDYIKAKEIVEKALILKKQNEAAPRVSLVNDFYLLGRIHMRLGEYDRSNQFLEKARNIVEEVYGAESFEIVKVLHALAKNHICGNNYKTSRLLLEKALLIQQRSKDSEEVMLVDNLIQLGRVNIALGEYRKSKKILKNALKIKKKIYGSRHIEVAHVLHQLGRCYALLGRFEKSQKLLETAESIKKNYYGPNHIENAYVLHHLAKTYLYLGLYEKSHQAISNALKLKEQHNGKNHPDYAYTLTYLGVTMFQLGKIEEAETILKESLRIKSEYFGEEAMDLTDTLQDLGTVYFSLGKYKESIDALKKSCQIKRNNYIIDNIDIANLFTKLSWNYYQLGQREKFLTFLTDACEIIKSEYTENSIFFVQAQINLATAYRLLGNYSQSKILYESAHLQYKKMNMDHGITLAKLYANLGITYKTQGDSVKGNHFFEHALKQMKTKYSEHPDIKKMEILREEKNIEDIEQARLGFLITLSF